MATRIGRVLQDQNLNLQFHDVSSVWKTKAPKKGGLGGRTPLGDLSNSLKSSLNTDAATKKKDSSKLQSGGRKALSDISNSGVPNAGAASKKKQNGKLKLSTIAEEQFLHDHQKCIKAQRGYVELDQFLQILGLDDGSKENVQKHEMTAKDEVVLRKLESEEMMEASFEEYRVEEEGPPCASPEFSPNGCFRWKDDEFVNFKLIESPKKLLL